MCTYNISEISAAKTHFFRTLCGGIEDPAFHNGGLMNPQNLPYVSIYEVTSE